MTGVCRHHAKHAMPPFYAPHHVTTDPFDAIWVRHAATRRLAQHHMPSSLASPVGFEHSANPALGALQVGNGRDGGRPPRDARDYLLVGAALMTP